MNIRIAKEEDAVTIAKVHVDTWKSAYKGVVDDDYLEKMSYESSEIINKIFIADKSIHSFIVENDRGEIIGFLMGGVFRNYDNSEVYDFDSEVFGIYILSEYQKSGVGRRLISTFVCEAIKDGHENMAVWVLRDNVSSGFYINLGGKLIAIKNMTIGGSDLAVELYGWESLESLK